MKFTLSMEGQSQEEVLMRLDKELEKEGMGSHFLFVLNVCLGMVVATLGPERADRWISEAIAALATTKMTGTVEK